jgi:hypothetical protein
MTFGDVVHEIATIIMLLLIAVFEFFTLFTVMFIKLIVLTACVGGFLGGIIWLMWNLLVQTSTLWQG